MATPIIVQHGSGLERSKAHSDDVDPCMACLQVIPTVWYGLCGFCYSGVHNYFLNILNIDTIKFLKLKKDILENFNFYEVLFKDNKNFEHFRKIIFYENKNLSFEKVFNFKNEKENFNLFKNSKSTKGQKPVGTYSLVGSTDNEGISFVGSGTTDVKQSAITTPTSRYSYTEDGGGSRKIDPAEGKMPAAVVEEVEMEDQEDLDLEEIRNDYEEYEDEYTTEGRVIPVGMPVDLNLEEKEDEAPYGRATPRRGTPGLLSFSAEDDGEDDDDVDEEENEDLGNYHFGNYDDEEDEDVDENDYENENDDENEDKDKDEYEKEIEEENDDEDEDAGASGENEVKDPAADSRAEKPTGAPGGTKKSLADEGIIKWDPEDRVRGVRDPEEDVSRGMEKEKGTVADDRSQKVKKLSMEIELEVEKDEEIEEEVEVDEEEQKQEGSPVVDDGQHNPEEQENRFSNEKLIEDEEVEDIIIRKLNEEIERWKKIKEERLKKEKEESEEKIDIKIDLEKIDEIIDLEIDEDLVNEEKVKNYDGENKNLDKLILDEKGKIFGKEKTKKFYGIVLRRKIKNLGRKFGCKIFRWIGEKFSRWKEMKKFWFCRKKLKSPKKLLWMRSGKIAWWTFGKFSRWKNHVLNINKLWEWCVLIFSRWKKSDDWLFWIDGYLGNKNFSLEKFLQSPGGMLDNYGCSHP